MAALVGTLIVGGVVCVIVLIALFWLYINFGVGHLTGVLMRWPALGISVVAAEGWLLSAVGSHLKDQGGFVVGASLAFLGWVIGFLTAAGPFYEKRTIDALVAGLMGLTLSLALGVPGAVGLCLGAVVALERRCSPTTLALFFWMACLCSGLQLLPSLLLLAGLAALGRRVFYA